MAGPVSGRSDHPDHVAVNPLRERIRDMLDASEGRCDGATRWGDA